MGTVQFFFSQVPYYTCDLVARALCEDKLWFSNLVKKAPARPVMLGKMPGRMMPKWLCIGITC